MLLADSGYRINDRLIRLVKLRSLIDQTCFEFIDVIYFRFGMVNFIPQKTYVVLC